MSHLVFAAECMTCQPWVRLWRNPVTGIHVRQVQHETNCTHYPKFTRDDIAALTGD